ncbi:MAG: alpha/beta hydrolase-fold protein [Kiritimatiellae bacterium]|jgi:enterochelin esterase-like enzyme|nr:alpha/beta hydrolase-fold protein [Kiritimatiellia bacterium]
MNEVIHKIQSAALGNERNLWVRIPANQGNTPNLVIILDAEMYRGRVDAVPVLDQLVHKEEISDSLFVFVSSESIESRWKECPCHPQFAIFIEKELIPWLEHRYPVISSAPEKVLVGLSYTGLAASYVALMTNGLFSKVISQSGSYWFNDCQLIEQYKEIAEPILFSHYINAGNRETQTDIEHKAGVFQSISQLDAVQRFRNVLRDKQCEVLYEVFDGAHSAECWRATLSSALKWALPINNTTPSSQSIPSNALVNSI